MKNLLFASLLLLAAAGAFSWQRAYAKALREINMGLRAQLSQNEQSELQLEQQNEAARKRIEESEAALLELETRVARAATDARRSTPSSSTKPDLTANHWRDDVPFVRLSKGHLTSLSVRTVASDAAGGYHLAAPAATLLGLSAEELIVVNEAIRSLCEQYFALELANAPQTPKYRHTREGVETIFSIPRLQIEGAESELKRAFREVVMGAVGKTRTDLILNYGEDEFYRRLAGFGENAKTIEMVPRLDKEGREQLKCYVHFEGRRNGGYVFTMPSDDDPNAPLCRALWERAQAAAK